MPNKGETPDPLYHGARMEALGCGKLLAPQLSFRDSAQTQEQLAETAKAVRDCLVGVPETKRRCQEWKLKLEDSGTTEGVPIAVDTVRRLVASVIMSREGPKPIAPSSVLQHRPRSVE